MYKFKSLIVIVVFLIFVTFLNCNKSKDYDNETSLINEAFLFYKNELINNKNSFQNPTPRQESNKILQWDKARILKLEKVDAVVIPLKYDTEFFGKSNKKNIKNIDANSYTDVVIYKGFDNKFHSEIITTFPDTNNIQQSKAKFEGFVLVENWNLEVLTFFKFKNSSVRQFFIKNPLNSVSPPDLLPNSSVQICTYIDWYVCSGEYCNFSHSTLVGCYSIDVGSGGGSGDITIRDYGVIHGSGGGGGGAGTGGINTSPKTIENKITNPCILSVYNRISEDRILNIINTTLMDFNDDKNYVFKFTDIWRNGTLDAHTTAIRNTQGVVTGYSIQFNPRIANYSMELIAEIICHEILHAYLSTENITNQEETIFYGFINKLVEVNRQLFPNMSVRDAYALAFYGVSQLNYYEESSAIFQAELAKHLLTVDDIDAIYEKHTTGQAGHKCGTN